MPTAERTDTTSFSAADLTFGIEIETIAPESAVANDGLRIGPYQRGIQVPYLPTGWTAENDGSISHSGDDRACEIVSPILRGPEGIAQVAEVLKTLQAKGHRVNASCGVHVHIGWNREWPSEALARLVTIVAYVEKGLYAITGTKQRERGRFCGGVRRYGNQHQAKDHIERGRYHALNLTNLADGTQDAVEFRVFSGSLQAVKVIGWIQVCLGLVQRALVARRMPRFSPKPPTGGWKKAGEGRSEAERLIGYLAWAPGYARLHNGRCFGWIAADFDQDQIKTEFRRLAKKYDAQA